MERRLHTPARRLGTSRAGPMKGEAERRSLRRPEGTERGLFSVSDGDVPPDGGGGSHQHVAALPSLSAHICPPPVPYFSMNPVLLPHSVSVASPLFFFPRCLDTNIFICLFFVCSPSVAVRSKWPQDVCCDLFAFTYISSAKGEKKGSRRIVSS